MEKEIIFTCPTCEQNYTVQHLEQPVTECPVCGRVDWKREDKLTKQWLDEGREPPEPEYLLLKWGTLKDWSGLKSDKTKALVKRYLDLGASMSAMMQRDTPEQKQIICELIDALDGEVSNDWSGEVMTKDQAKEYVQNYGNQ